MEKKKSLARKWKIDNEKPCPIFISLIVGACPSQTDGLLFVDLALCNFLTSGNRSGFLEPEMARGIGRWRRLPSSAMWNDSWIAMGWHWKISSSLAMDGYGWPWMAMVRKQPRNQRMASTSHPNWEVPRAGAPHEIPRWLQAGVDQRIHKAPATECGATHGR